jgi:hypothetical protein
MKSNMERDKQVLTGSKKYNYNTNMTSSSTFTTY